MFDIDGTLAQLTLAEKISLLTGSDMWHTTALSRLNIPAVRLTDGREWSSPLSHDCWLSDLIASQRVQRQCHFADLVSSLARLQRLVLEAQRFSLASLATVTP
jgi:hypothetical protein